MQIHQVKPKNKSRVGRRIGRGGKRGTTSGRGTKGQKSRAGHKIRPEIRDTIKKLPKSRGFKFSSFKQKPTILNLSEINRYFNAGDRVSPKILFEKKLIKAPKGNGGGIKILGQGDFNKKIIFEGVHCSSSAREKILKAGGAVK